MLKINAMNSLVLLLFSSLFLAQLVIKFSGYSGFNYISYFIAIAGIVYSLKNIRINKTVFPVLFIYILFLIFRGIVGLFDEFSYRPMYQLFHEFKFLIFFVFFSQVSFNKELIAQTEKVIKVILCLSLICVFIQYLLPEIYRSIFLSSNSVGEFIHRGYNLQRAEGVFIHSSGLALFCISSYLYFHFICNRVLPYWKALSIFLLVLSLQRLEILFFLVFFITQLYTSESQYFKYRSSKKIMVACLGAIIVFILLPDLISLFNEFVVLSSNAISPRTLLFIEGFKIFKTAPLFGVGLGQFASHGAAEFGSSFYDASVISDTWWFRKGLYLYDTFWPHVLAEQGAIGLLLFLGVLLSIYRSISAHLNTFTSQYSKWIFLFILLISLGSAVYMSSIHLTLLFMCIGSLNYER